MNVVQLLSMKTQNPIPSTNHPSIRLLSCSSFSSRLECAAVAVDGGGGLYFFFAATLTLVRYFRTIMVMVPFRSGHRVVIPLKNKNNHTNNNCDDCVIYRKIVGCNCHSFGLLSCPICHILSFFLYPYLVSQYFYYYTAPSRTLHYILFTTNFLPFFIFCRKFEIRRHAAKVIILYSKRIFWRVRVCLFVEKEMVGTGILDRHCLKSLSPFHYKKIVEMMSHSLLICFYRSPSLFYHISNLLSHCKVSKEISVVVEMAARACFVALSAFSMKSRNIIGLENRFI